MERKNGVINASEIAEYEFCPTAWYLKRCGVRPSSPKILSGTLHHAEEQRKVVAAKHSSLLASKLRFVGTALIILALILVLLLI